MGIEKKCDCCLDGMAFSDAFNDFVIEQNNNFISIITELQEMFPETPIIDFVNMRNRKLNSQVKNMIKKIYDNKK